LEQNDDLHMDEWRGWSAAALQSSSNFARGAPVLKWAAERVQDDKALVQFLVWANPLNLRFASPALQADLEVVAAALASPFYAEPPPPVPLSCVLRFASKELRSSKELVLAAVTRSGYEFEFAGDALRADAYVAAWAGAPGGAAQCREMSKTFMRVLKSDFSVEYMDANWKSILTDDCCAATRLGDCNLKHILAQWSKLPLGMPQPFYFGNERDKHAVCALLKQALTARCPLCLRVAPSVRDVLWPTREEWDGVF
jgi:hypothetical protein